MLFFVKTRSICNAYRLINVVVVSESDKHGYIMIQLLFINYHLIISHIIILHGIVMTINCTLLVNVICYLPSPR